MIRNSLVSTLVIQVQTGVGATGKPMLKAKSYPFLSPSVTDDVVYEVGQAIASLQSDPLHAIERIDRAELVSAPSTTTTTTTTTN